MLTIALTTALKTFYSITYLVKVPLHRSFYDTLSEMLFSYFYSLPYTINRQCRESNTFYNNNICMSYQRQNIALCINIYLRSGFHVFQIINSDADLILILRCRVVHCHPSTTTIKLV
ncbi:unnamed protein product [Chrysodeixis includens]|uniref:Uncharacterized protein n=1 Tax=Chrysodeixis includens TaxID=689277 RepID=A0A9P0BTQ9_CHRIL|nr:unnamed protein product [Chrysodeixis includens]